MSGSTGPEIQPQIYFPHDELRTLFELVDARKQNGGFLSRVEIESKLGEYNLEELFTPMYLDMFKDTNGEVDYQLLTDHILNVKGYPLRVETTEHEGLTQQVLSIRGENWFRQIKSLRSNNFNLSMFEGIASIRVLLPQDAKGSPVLIMKIFKQTSLGLDQRDPSGDELRGGIICRIDLEHQTLHQLEKIDQSKMWPAVKNAFALFGIDLPIHLIEN